jgi:hypothetical protein
VILGTSIRQLPGRATAACARIRHAHRAGTAGDLPAWLARTLADIDIEWPLPLQIIALLQKHIAEIVVMPDVKAMLDKLSFQPVGRTPAQFSDRIKNDIVVWSKAILSPRSVWLQPSTARPARI